MPQRNRSQKQNNYNTKSISVKMLILLLIFIKTQTQDQQNFTYTQSDKLVILPSSQMSIYGTLSTVQDEYLSSSSINICTSIFQIGQDQGKYAYYNMYYFNLTSKQGMQCYKNWTLFGQITRQSNCPEITTLYQQACHNYSNCFDEQISYTLSLNQWQYVQHIFYIHNIHPKYQLNLHTTVSIVLISSNAWFFWAVGLTCLLMIMMVVLSGVVFNLNLKMKRTKKMYEQYKLTVENQIDFNISDGTESKDD